MSENKIQIDFLIITALDDEVKAFEELLENKSNWDEFTTGTVKIEDSSNHYTIGLLSVNSMGTNAIQYHIHDAIIRMNPRRVILAGIAAGFPESNVKYGDILVPNQIDYYELLKIRENKSEKQDAVCDNYQDKQYVYDHRSTPYMVSYPMFHTADILSRNIKSNWAALIKANRPDGTDNIPTVHSKNNSTLGCGEKIVASEYAEGRKYLIDKYKSDAIGLEMESFGVALVCYKKEKPFLVVKAVQDYATNDKEGSKQNANEKDKWREYACQAAASFTVKLIASIPYEKVKEDDNTILLRKHMKESEGIINSFEKTAPKPLFDYEISIAESFSHLKREMYACSSEDLRLLVPDGTKPKIIIHGGGGAGKTRVAKNIFGVLVREGLCPTFVDLKKFSLEIEKGIENNETKIITDLMHFGSMPKRTKEELEILVKKADVVVILDGINEIPHDIRETIINYFSNLHRIGTCYQILTDRLGPSGLTGSFMYATVNKLSLEKAMKAFDQRFEEGSFSKLNIRLQKIYQTPFFLSLALRAKVRFSEKHIRSEIFQSFFIEQIGISDDQIDNISQVLINSFNDDGSVNPNKFIADWESNGLFRKLIESEVIDENGGFSHDLWRDYLTARFLSIDNKNWSYRNFDLNTTFASSIESLTLAIEQLKSMALRDKFLKKVYDWNYVAAVDCMAEFLHNDSNNEVLSPNIINVILAAITDKKFDSIRRTRKRAEEIIQNQQYDKARAFQRCTNRAELINLVRVLDGSEEWYKKWRDLFTKSTVDVLTETEIYEITSEDSIIGWTIANVARRLNISFEMQKKVMEIYNEFNSDEHQSTRWRIVHVMGQYPSNECLVFLNNALNNDRYHWVKYGAARAIIEIASMSEGDLRKDAIIVLQGFISKKSEVSTNMYRNISKEIFVASFIDNPKIHWAQDIEPLLNEIINSEIDLEQKEEFRAMLTMFKDSYVD